VIFGLLSFDSFAQSAIHNQNLVALALWMPLVLLAARWPVAAMITAGIVLRVSFLTVCCTDQIAVSHAAWDRVADGLGGPYGLGYAATDPPGGPFPYGPLGLIWWLPGPVVELIAAAAVLAILAWHGSLITLAIFAVWQPAVWLNVAGVNDYSPAALLLVAFIAMRSRPIVGAAVLSVAAALKPYVFAWFLPAIGFGGIPVAVVLAATTAVLWSPLFVFWGGIGSFLKTIEIAARIHPVPNALDMPVLRWIAVAIALGSLFVRRWEAAVLLGSAAFVVFLFLDRWASYAYFLAVIPITGLAIESLLGLVSWRPLPFAKRIGIRRSMSTASGGSSPA
jgi:hypothetical protein